MRCSTQRKARQRDPAATSRARRHRTRAADYWLEIRTPDGTETLTSERVVNAAGLEADRVATLAGIDVEAAGYLLHWWKGSYFAVNGAQARLLSRLVYPVPDHVSLGVHAVLGLEGRLRFGPDAEYLPDRSLDYGVNEAKRDAFAEAVRRLVPGDHGRGPEPRHRGRARKAAGTRTRIPRLRDRRGDRARAARLREPRGNRLARPDFGPRHRRRGRAAARVTQRTPQATVRWPTSCPRSVAVFNTFRSEG